MYQEKGQQSVVVLLDRFSKFPNNNKKCIFLRESVCAFTCVCVCAFASECVGGAFCVCVGGGGVRLFVLDKSEQLCQ